MDTDKNKGVDDGKQMDHLIYFSIVADTLVTGIFMSSIFYGSFYSCVYCCNKYLHYIFLLEKKIEIYCSKTHSHMTQIP